VFADPSTRLSPNFTVGEFTKSMTATRHGINNGLPTKLLANAMRTAMHLLQPVRDHFNIPFSPSSGFRCLSLNRIIGSDDTSDHVEARACDFEVPGIPNIDVARWCAHSLEYDQLILEFYDPNDPTAGWVHASFRTRVANRGQVLRYYGKGHYEEGLG
jgi:zinc D-Ala-D-Ala carboxypeptidase